MEGKTRRQTNGDYCTVLGCKNNRRSKFNVIKCHVGILRWHSPRNEADANAWQEALNRGSDFKVRLKRTKVCSNHFAAGYYNPDCPVPTLYMKGYDISERTRKDTTVNGDIPQKRRRRAVVVSDQNVVGNAGTFHNLSVDNSAAAAISTVDIHDHDYFTTAKIVGSCRTRKFTECQNDNCIEERRNERKVYSDFLGKEAFLQQKIKILEEGNKSLKRQNLDYLMENGNRKGLSFNNIKGNDHHVRMMTGFHNSNLYEWMLNRIIYKVPLITSCGNESTQKVKGNRKRKAGTPHLLSPENEMLLTMMKIRMGLSHDDLAFRFNISKKTCTCIIRTWIPFLSNEMNVFVGSVIRGQGTCPYPDCFKAFGTHVVSILNCTTGEYEHASNSRAQRRGLSLCKSRNTWRKAIGITPAGTVNFVSNSYGGSASDRFIIENSEFLDTLNPGDKVIADKCMYNISDLLSSRQCTLVIPQCVRNNGKFNKHLTKKSARITEACTYVERAVARVQDFRILQSPLPLSMKNLLDDIFIIIAGITNLGPPLCGSQIKL